MAYKKPPEDQQFEPLVSVLLTSYNRPKMVQEAIESVLNQTYQNFELIILDDNSSEETQKVLSRYLNGSKVKFYKSDVKDEDRWKEARYAVLFNVGLKMAKGELITYLCDDDYFLPQRLERMVKESLRLAKENNKRIRSIQRGMFVNGIVRLLVWAVILGLPVFIYFSLLKPYVDGAATTFETIKSGDVGGIQDLISIPGLDILQNAIENNKVETAE